MTQEEKHANFFEFLKESFLRHDGKLTDEDLVVLDKVCFDIEGYNALVFDSPEYKEVQRALTSLYIGIPSDIANDVKKKVDSFVELI